MIVDGKKIRDMIAESLKEEVLLFEKTPVLHVIYVGTNPVIDQFVGVKKSFGESLGIHVYVHRFPNDISYDELKKEVSDVLSEDGGVIIQLPLPDHLPKQNILDLIPKERDPDMLSTESRHWFQSGMSLILPPVVASVKEILSVHEVNLDNKKVVVVGKGRLVGAPVALWLARSSADVVVFDKGDSPELLKTADVIISGAGDPHFIKPEMVKNECVLIDAGTSGSSGQSKGDVDPSCRDVASVFSPVPGGVGPITVAKLFQNMLTLLRS